MQELCRGNYGWDSEILPAVAKRWETWIGGLNQLTSLNIRRCYRPQDFGEVCDAQLHLFCDASEVGYGTASCLKLTNTRGLIYIAFVMGKGKSSPTETDHHSQNGTASRSPGRSNQQNAGKELEYSLQPPVYWSDSTSVMKYIFSDTIRFQTYVANRVSTIRDLAEKSQWRYLNSALNPADDASWGLTAEMFLKSEQLLHGPF